MTVNQLIKCPKCGQVSMHFETKCSKMNCGEWIFNRCPYESQIKDKCYWCKKCQSHFQIGVMDKRKEVVQFT